MVKARILVVEDEQAQRLLVTRILKREGYTVTDCSSVPDALAALSSQRFDLVLSDWKLGEQDGMDLLATLQEQEHDAELRPAFVMITAFGTVTHAMEAVRAGADDYLEKPFEKGALLLALERTLRSHKLHEENQRLQAELTQRDRLVDLIGKSPKMLRLFRTVEKVARTGATVLVAGESGTGKELAARALHTLSPRKNQAFVVVNCAAIPEGLLESEFFGVEKGAYTGAHKQRQGKFQAADKGTLFLDEIGELPLSLQSKLLRVLQDKRVSPVGATQDQSMDVRIIAASNRDLSEEVRAGRFREDLFYRLNVVTLEMPPLRERRDDISALITHFLSHFSKLHSVPAPKLSSALKRRLLDHSWPGNVRQLANTIERLVVLSEEAHCTLDDLPSDFHQSPGAESRFKLPPEGLNWEEHERSCLQQALEMCRNNRSQAAKLLGLPYKAFLYRLEKKHGLS